MLTLDSTDAFDSIPNLHVVSLEGHEDSIGVVGLSLGVHLGVAVLELKAIVAVILNYFPVHFKVLFHPVERQVDLEAFSSAFDRGFVIDKAVDFLKLDAADNRWRLRGLWGMLLAAEAFVPYLRTRSDEGGSRKEVYRGIVGAAVPE